MVQKISLAFQNIVLSQIVKISERVREKAVEFEKTHKKPFIRFQRGDLGIDIPAYVRDAINEGLEKGLTKYPKSGGEPWFKDAVINHLEEMGIKNIKRDNVIATYGGQEGLQLVFSLFRGSKCLAFSPCWSCMLDNIFPYSETDYKLLPLKENFEIDFDEFEKNLKHSDILYLNNPHNPTGKVFTYEELERINHLCKKYDVLIVSDEAYKDIIFDNNRFHSMLEFDNKDVVSVFTFSKSFAATGFRAGYTVSRNSFIIEKMTLGDYSQTAGVVTFIQYAFKVALENKEEKDKWLKWFLNKLKKRRDIAYEELKEFVKDVYKPGGTFYFFVNLKDLIKKEVKNYDEYILDLLIENGVAVTPGSAFGRDFEGFIRISTSALEENLIKEGIKRIGEIFKSI